MQLQALTLELGGHARTRLVARVATYVAGRGLEILRLDYSDVADTGFLLLRVSGPAARLDPLVHQLARIPGVVSVMAPPDLRSGLLVLDDGDARPPVAADRVTTPSRGGG